ncbi:hypothetical protein C7M61_004752 [Candidozyma pseudohaemuli]|uniref:Peroxisomal ATPase PEX6 n=1 Tax=Candidozyma pseudohaemuli TaxID=418784 RepID=A0A2P7YH65_9ASCO|nr:hypothetical protein C7M61_004752 [[Candida] pseudohaemulonii]PSK35294.1 hypothetical protein C7M61_004752 [[Candida] pseudohaemulonii]
MPLSVESKDPSIATVANVHVINDPTLLQTDQVALSFELFVRLFPNTQKDVPMNDKEPKFVLIKFIGVPDYFNEFVVHRVSLIDNESPTSSSVTITNHSNLVKFGNNITVNGCVIQSIDADSIPLLTKAYVEVPDGVFHVLQNTPSLIVKENFVDQWTASNGAVVSINSAVRAINGTVKLCEPFFQGKVDANTELIFVKKPIEQPKVEEVQEEEIEDDFDVSQYLSQSMHLNSSDDFESKYPLKVLPLPEKISINDLPTFFAREDPDLYAYLSTDDLSKIGFPLFNGDLASLCVGNLETTIKVFTVLEPNKSFQPGTIYLSPLLLVNLEVDDDTEVTLKPYQSKNNTFTDAFPIAKTATISRIASPITTDRTYQQSFLSELKNKFHSCVKIVRQGDVIPVCIDTVLAKTIFDVSAQQQQNKGEGEDEQSNYPSVPLSGNPDAVAWFKVLEVSGADNEDIQGQFRIDPSQTALTSSGVEFLRAPKNAFNDFLSYLQLPPLFNFTEAIEAAPSHFKYAEEFQKIMQTTVDSKSNIRLKTTILLNSMSRGLGKTTMVRSLALNMGLNLIELDAFDFVKPGAELKSVGLLSGRIEKYLNGQLEAANSNCFHILYIKHIENLCVQTDPNEQRASSSTSLSLRVVQTLKDFLDKYENMALVASCNDIDKLSESFTQIVKFQIDVSVPDEQERRQIFRYLLDKETKALNTEALPQAFEDKVEFEGRLDIFSLKFAKRSDVSYQSLALLSAGLTPRDLNSIVRKSKQLAIKRLMARAKDAGISFEKIVKIANGGLVQLTPEDFDKAINEARNQFSDSIGAPRIPNVKWEDIGGLDTVKGEILDTIDMPLKHPELFSNGLKKRSGILFYGPPGTGKTLLAKAIATNFSLNFFSVKGPELLNMYIGESEANVRRVFQKARDAKPCVIFFDELDSVAPKRGNQGDSGGVMDRIVSQLLAELDGMSGGESNGDGVFVVGATNRPDLLDEALLRPGRFDKMLYLGISDTDDKQTKILEALTRKFKLSDEVDLALIAEKCSFTLTGADFYALCSDSMLNAMTRTANEVDAKLKTFNEQRVADKKEEVSSRWWFDNVATPADINVLVTMQDFEKSLSELVPSVSADELNHYLRVKENFEGGKKKAQETENQPQQDGQGIPQQLLEELRANGHDVDGLENGTITINGNGHGHT